MSRFKIQERFSELQNAGYKKKGNGLKMRDLLMQKENLIGPEIVKKFRKDETMKVGKSTLNWSNIENIGNLDPNT